MLQNGGDASFEERKVHQADATQVRFLLVLGNDLAESTDDFFRGRTKGHDTLVLGWDGKIVEGKAGQVASITTLLSQALCKGSKNIVLSTANHWDTVLFVPNIAELVDSLGSSGTLFALGVEHRLDELGDVIEGGRLSRSAFWSSLSRQNEW